MKYRLPERIRVSIGSAILLDLMKGKMDVVPTTIYLLTYHWGKCRANCTFCSQAQSSMSRSDLLSRVAWPVFSTSLFLTQLKATAKKKGFRRVCLQAINYAHVFEDMLSLVKEVRKADIPISISCQPLNADQIRQLAEAGIDRLGIPLDLATKSLFERVKGKLTGSPYSWETHLSALNAAVKYVGKSHVSTHFIVGLGETDFEMVQIIQKMIDKGIFPSLFAFTPVPGSQMEGKTQPPISRYRRLQLAHFLLVSRLKRSEDLKFNSRGQLTTYDLDDTSLATIIKSGAPFRTSGCPGCNRPYYNERPGGVIYNFPRSPNMDELIKVEKQISGDCP